MIRLMTASFKTERVLATEGKVCLSHIARTLHAPHAELAAAMEKEGYLTAYDGMQWEIAPHGDAADGEK